MAEGKGGETPPGPRPPDTDGSEAAARIEDARLGNGGDGSDGTADGCASTLGETDATCPPTVRTKRRR